MHGLEETRSWADKLLQHKAVLSLEVVSTRKEGIRFIVRVAANDRNAFEKGIASYLLDVRVKAVDDYLSPTLHWGNVKILEFKQTNHFAYPLQPHDSLQESDPLAYLTGTMTQLAPDEQIIFQIVTSPATVRATNAIRKKILNNEHLLEHRSSRKRQLFPMQRIFYAINSVLFSIKDTVGETYHGSMALRHHSVKRNRTRR